LCDVSRFGDGHEVCLGKIEPLNFVDLDCPKQGLLVNDSDRFESDDGSNRARDLPARRFVERFQYVHDLSDDLPSATMPESLPSSVALLRRCPLTPKDIVAALPEPQRTEVDALVKAVGTFLHSGRHVSQVGESAGSFPVDRQAAYLALSTMKVMLSYLSQIVG
jgi:hypothetical protein